MGGGGTLTWPQGSARTWERRRPGGAAQCVPQDSPHLRNLYVGLVRTQAWVQAFAKRGLLRLDAVATFNPIQPLRAGGRVPPAGHVALVNKVDSQLQGAPRPPPPPAPVPATSGGG